MIGETHGALVELDGGLMVREAAYHLLLGLEARGHTCSVAANGTLLVTQSRALTPDDRAAITLHRRHLMAMLGHLG